MEKLRSKIEQFIEKASGLRVAVIGETIIDEFVPAVYEGHSMKSFCPVFKTIEGSEKQVQEGGSAAIAGHLRGFVKHVELISNTHNEIVKTRYIDAFDQKKHVEINTFNNSGFDAIKLDTKDYDVVIVADFGHGFCNKLDINEGFHLMCQTNSNNFGFNRMSKWKHLRKRSVTLDLREASLQMNRKMNGSDTAEIMDLYNYEINADLMFVTLGGKGSMVTNGEEILHQEAFRSKIVDTIGAGDTFFAFSCIMAHLMDKADQEIPALAASLSTTWLCNERSVNPKALLDYADQIIRG